MHEISLVENLLEQVSRQALLRSGAIVHRIEVRIGEVSGVEAELFASAFEQLRAGTPFQDARLEIRRVAADWRCRGCERGVFAGEALCCKDCGVPAELVAGSELMLDRIELEVSDV